MSQVPSFGRRIKKEFADIAQRRFFKWSRTLIVVVWVWLIQIFSHEKVIFKIFGVMWFFKLGI
ncbi:CLUMA_CG021119, isoform A [Clunio marinus]|uniref:CLUMA_CG021119, isoform A n=1 Tax=Clunio marinus TaxID=568069 RepID=A0A1J1J6D5_9DIPT|nr:CLUMA_CG021119, isoform A [Clunio marinus]